MTRFTTRTLHDAGLLREYTASRYGHVFEFGASAGVYARAMGLAKQLCRLTGDDLDTVVEALRSDYLNAN